MYMMWCRGTVCQGVEATRHKITQGTPWGRTAARRLRRTGLGKKADKYGKKGDGKKDPAAGKKDEKSFTHQTCRHILVQKQSQALQISEEIHNGKITFNEAAFKYSEDKAGAYGLLGDKAQNEVRLSFAPVYTTISC